MPVSTLGIETTMGANGVLFVECLLIWHLAKAPSPSVGTAWRLFLSSARRKVLNKKAVTDKLFTESSLPSAALGKVFTECLGKVLCSTVPIVHLSNLSPTHVSPFVLFDGHNINLSFEMDIVNILLFLNKYMISLKEIYKSFINIKKLM